MALQATLRALADPIRREILNLLKKGRLSRHLSVLREADLIRDKREGKFIFYELNASVLEETMLWLADLKGAKNDAETV